MIDCNIKDKSKPHFVLTGASGWFGRTALWELEKLMGPELLRQRVRAFASSAKAIDFSSPHGPLQALPITELNRVENPSGLLHLAFLTRERVSAEGLESYIQQNRTITATVAALIERNPTMPIMTTSSGAAAALDGGPGDLQGDPYGTLKQEEEALWKLHSASRMAVVFRVYAASGRFLKDPSLFALGDFIQQAQAGKTITIRSPRPVIRSYVHVGTLMRLAWLMLMQPLAAGYRQIDAITDTISLLELANCISQHWDLPPAHSTIDPNLPADQYAGDPKEFDKLLQHYEIRSPPLLDQILETAASIRGK